jgi:predicted DNA-binding protein YlxM (UPF0122 family)
MDDLTATRELLSRQLAEAIDEDPIGTIPTIAALQRETDAHLREAVRQAATTSSWQEIADGLGVSKQAAHQRFKAYAKDVAAQLKTEHKAMKRARRSGNAAEAAQHRARRDELVSDLKSAADELKQGYRGH